MIATAQENGHGLVRLTFSDGRPVMEAPPDWPELALWAEQPGNAIAAADAAPPALLLPYQEGRKAGYIDLDIAMGKRPEGAPGSAENTAGHVTDATLTMLETMRIASGVPATPEWAALIAGVQTVKAAHPKPPEEEE